MGAVLNMRVSFSRIAGGEAGRWRGCLREIDRTNAVPAVDGRLPRSRNVLQW